MDQLETESPGTSPLLPLALGAVNWLGLWTHCVKEVHRFFKVGFQTLMAPTVTTLLFLAIFTLAFGRRVPNLGGVTFAEFLAPGLIMMAIIQNAFANTSSSIMISKIQGNIVDVLMPPLTPGELAFGFIMGGVARGVLVALMVGGAMAVFVPIHIGHIGLIVFHTLAASIMLSILGLLAGIWADKFDQVASITNFIVTPLVVSFGDVLFDRPSAARLAGSRRVQPIFLPDRRIQIWFHRSRRRIVAGRGGGDHDCQRRPVGLVLLDVPDRLQAQILDIIISTGTRTGRQCCR